MNFTLKILIFICIANSTFAQNMLTLTAAELAVLQNNPQVKATAWDVKAKKYAEKGALNLSNPEINLESPTGEFYTLGVSQSFELPRVYSRQKQLAKAETALAKAGLSVTENDMRYALRSLYLAAQVSHYKTEQWQKRDTLYKQIAATAVRQFEAGEIDFLQKTMAENEAGKVYQERLAAEMETTSLLVQLKLLTGFTDFTDLEPFSTDSLNILFLPQDQDVVNPSIIYEQQAAKVAENQIGMAKSRVLPNFSLGYMNQGARNTPLDLRFRASIGVPLWAGQYLAAQKSAKAESQAAIARAEAQSQTIAIEKEKVVGAARTAWSKAKHYEKEALPRSRSLIVAATRMREAGQIDYITFLRTLDDAFSTQLEYAEQLHALYSARFQMQYLSGN